MKRIGHKMRWCAELARQCPGESMLWHAQVLGPHGSRKYGYAIVHRAHKAGIIDLIRSPRRRGTYLVVPAGEKLT